jgi:peptidoglycan/LPS O-acetylase OafA/YrhL
MQLKSNDAASTVTPVVDAATGIVTVASVQQLPPSGYLPTLDGWRAIAILAVIICHAASGLFETSGPHPSQIGLLLEHGAVGVNIFFGISGFLICSRLLEEHRKNGRISLKGFYIRRCFRILPPYLAYLFLVGLAGLAGVVAVTRVEWLSCLLFFRNYLPMPDTGGAGWYTAHFWSLAVEEHFYLLWPGLLVLLGIKRTRLLVVPLCVAIAAWRYVEFREHFVNRLIPGIGFSMRTDTCLDGLLWGCAIALLLAVPGWGQRLTRWLSPWTWAVIVVAFVFCVLRNPPMSATWLGLLIPLMLVGTVLRPKTWMGQFLETGPMEWIGRMSYSLYLWQQMFLAAGHVDRLPFGRWQQIPLNIAIIFGLATASYYFVEKPLIKVGHRLAKPATPGRSDVKV